MALPVGRVVVAPSKRGGRGLKRACAARGVIGRSRPLQAGGARIETCSRLANSFARAVAPSKRGGRGLKHVQVNSRWSAPGVAPSKRGGRGLKHSERCRKIHGTVSPPPSGGGAD